MVKRTPGLEVIIIGAADVALRVIVYATPPPFRLDVILIIEPFEALDNAEVKADRVDTFTTDPGDSINRAGSNAPNCPDGAVGVEFTALDHALYPDELWAPTRKL